MKLYVAKCVIVIVAAFDLFRCCSQCDRNATQRQSDDNSSDSAIAALSKDNSSRINDEELSIYVESTTTVEPEQTTADYGIDYDNETTENNQDRQYVTISFVTNNPRSTTKRSERSTEEDTLFQFWSSESTKRSNGDANTKSEDLKSEKEQEDDDEFGSKAIDVDLKESNETESELSEEEKYVKEAAEYGLSKMKELYEVQEPKLYKMGLWLEDDNPARFVATFNWQSENARKFAQYGYATLQASAHLRQKLNTDGLESRAGQDTPRLASLKKSVLRQQCPLKGIPRCPPASKRYRTHDGTCNNLRRGRWGSALTPVERFLPPQYEDEVNRARGSDSDLPSPRLVSTHIHRGRRRDASSITHLLMQWGQFLDHDITSSSQARSFNGSIPRCCLDGGRHFVPSEFMHPDCMPIEVPEDDEFYGPLGIRCLEFVRSSPAPRVDCEFGWREQMNQVTSYIDASPIYSSSARQADKLRIFRNGLLQYGRAQARRPVLPPREDDEEALCQGGAVDASCFKAGDGRVNEHPGLVAMHIIWLRKHNRLATELAHLNPHWSDEKIYQETRKIIGALIQHITYKEFLPIILGSEVMRLFDLELMKNGYYKNYNSKVNPSPANAFSAAAFRFGHSLVQDSFLRYDRFHRPLTNNVSLHEELSNPTNIWSFGAVDRLILGMCNQPSQQRDEFITPELTNHLFQTTRFGFGMDLGAINIQRGRDHGIPPYTEWREPCGLSSVLEWFDLYKVMPKNTVENLRDIYRRVEDVDLFTGGMSEKPVIGGLVGPTFACIIAQQFSNLRRGDRFWYENGGFDSSFTPAQLQQIRRITLSQILCQTLESIDTIQPFVFLTPDNYRNERIPCDSIIRNFDLTPWTEREFDFTNTVNDFDRTNFIKSSSIKPRTTSKIPQHFQTSTIPNDKLTNDIGQNDSSQLTTLTLLDDKLDIPDRQTTPERLIIQTKTNTTDDKNQLTTTSDIKLDDKLDLSLIENKQNVTNNFGNELTAEHRSFSNSEDDRLQNDSLTLNKSKEEASQKTYDFLLNHDSQLPFFNTFLNRKTTTVKPYVQSKPQINIVSQDSYVTDNPNHFTYLINIIPKTTPKYEPNYPLRETIKITVQGTPSKNKPQNSPFLYDRRPVYENNKLEYRPIIQSTNSYDNFNYQSDNVYLKPRPTNSNSYRPQSQQTNYASSSNLNSYLDSFNSFQSSNINTPLYNRPYKPINSYTTEYNPYSLITFNHVETTKKYSYQSPLQHDTQNYYPSYNRPTRPTFVSNDDDNFYQKPATRPPNSGITIYIESKPSRPKPHRDPIINTGYNRPTHDSGEETIPLFNRPNYQKPLLNRPFPSKPSYQNIYSSSEIRDKDHPENTFTLLQSEHGHISTNNNWESYIKNDDKLKTKPDNANLETDVKFTSGNKDQYHSISIVIDPTLQNKDSYKYKSIMTTKRPIKYYYIGNVLHQYPVQNDQKINTAHDQMKRSDEIIKENYNNIWKPDKREHELYDDPSSSDALIEDIIEPISSKSEEFISLAKNESIENNKRESMAKMKHKNIGQVFFEVSPSENSPMTWIIYDEKPDGNLLNTPQNMPTLISDPHASEELPRPINFALIKRNKIKQN